jgi:hypothetical protein
MRIGLVEIQPVESGILSGKPMQDRFVSQRLSPLAFSHGTHTG